MLEMGAVRERLRGAWRGADRESAAAGGLPLGTRPFDRLPSIRAKLGAVIVFAVAVTILIMYLAIGFALRDSESDRERLELANEVRGVATFALTPSGEVSRAFIRAIGARPTPVLIVDTVGRPVYGMLPLPPTVGRTLAGYPDSGEVAGYEYFGLPIIREQQIVGGIYLSRSVEGGGLAGASASAVDFVSRYWWQLLLAGMVAAGIALVLARYLARGLTQPLRDMAQAAQRMAEGDYAQRVEPKSRDEVGRLAEAFNRMAGEVEGLEGLRRELVANVSHELKTPISALRAHLENLMDGVEQPNPAVLQVMLQQAERLSRLVDQLLDLSRLESGDVPLSLQPVELRALVDGVAGEVRVARPEFDPNIRNGVPDGLPPVLADRERLHQVLFNLLDNAVRFTPAGGLVSVNAIRTGRFCEVEVRDTGSGIPEEHLGLVFERFYRVDPSRSRGDGGTGIGLAIARSIVEAHGGRIWAERVPEAGASIRFVVPMSGPPEAAGEIEESPSGALAPSAGTSG
jgi:signal transduction histidine kinase